MMPDTMSERKFKDEWEIYNIEEDRTEQHNRADINKASSACSPNSKDWAASSFGDPWTLPPTHNWGAEPNRYSGSKKN